MAPPPYFEDEEEEAVPDMKALTGSGGDLPQEFWQVTASWSPPNPLLLGRGGGGHT